MSAVSSQQNFSQDCDCDPASGKDMSEYNDTDTALEDQVNKTFRAVAIGVIAVSSNSKRAHQLRPSPFSFGNSQQASAKMQTSTSNISNNRNTSPDNDIDVRHKERIRNLQNVFPLGWKMCICRLVEVVIMLNCYYLSTWVTVCIPMATATSDSMFWNVLGVIPVAVCLPLLCQTVVMSSRLLAVTELNIDVVGIIFERDEEMEGLLEELRAKLHAKWAEADAVDAVKTVLRRMFDVLSMDQSDGVSRLRFRKFLRLFNLHYSYVKSDRLFGVLDKHHRGSISFLDLYSTLYPELKQAEEKGESEWPSKMIESPPLPAVTEVPDFNDCNWPLETQPSEAQTGQVQPDTQPNSAQTVHALFKTLPSTGRAAKVLPTRQPSAIKSKGSLEVEDFGE